MVSRSLIPVLLRHAVNYCSRVIKDALIASSRSLGLELTERKQKILVESYLQFKTWPDVVPTLTTLKAAGIRLAFLSNFSPAMLSANIRSSELEDFFEYCLSTDAVQLYKPHPRAYRMGLEAFGLRRDEILFAAFAGWDAVGARRSVIRPFGSTANSNRSRSSTCCLTVRAPA
jgi:2-haloacid dehalogenase